LWVFVSTVNREEEMDDASLLSKLRDWRL